MNNFEFMSHYQQINSIQSKNEMLLILGGAVVITGLLAYSYYLQTQKLKAQAYIAAGQVNVMYWQKEAVQEALEISEAQTLHYKSEFEKIKQQVNAKIQIK